MDKVSAELVVFVMWIDEPTSTASLVELGLLEVAVKLLMLNEFTVSVIGPICNVPGSAGAADEPVSISDPPPPLLVMVAVKLACAADAARMEAAAAAKDKLSFLENINSPFQVNWFHKNRDTTLMTCRSATS
jgi:hypothetical protein